MTEHKIQSALFADLRQKGYLLCCPNYTPAQWWECDMMAITKAERFVEFEIKVSRADFKADARKTDSGVRGWDPVARKSFIEREAQTKHQRLALGDPKGPSRFFFVVPAGLITLDEVPEWAGLIYVAEPDRYSRMSLKTVKDAPKIHRDKAPARMVQHMSSVFYWRYWALRQGIPETEIPR